MRGASKISRSNVLLNQHSMSIGSLTSGNNIPMLPTHDKTPLSNLLEVAVQKTYHELYIMADMYVFLIFVECKSCIE